jgi:hypothetical protein
VPSDPGDRSKRQTPCGQGDNSNLSQTQNLWLDQGSDPRKGPHTVWASRASQPCARCCRSMGRRCPRCLSAVDLGEMARLTSRTRVGRTFDAIQRSRW